MPSRATSTAVATEALTPKQAKFCEEFLVDLNGTEAAKRAGYARESAYAQAGALLKINKVVQRIATLKAVRSQITNITAADVLERLADEVRADVADIFDDNGNLLPVNEWPMVWRTGLVAGIEVQTEYDEPETDPNTGEVLPPKAASRVTKIKLSDRVKRLELLGKHVNVQAFKENLNITVGVVAIDPKAMTEEQLRALAAIPTVPGQAQRQLPAPAHATSDDDPDGP